MNNEVIDSLLQEIVELKARVTELENAPQAAVLRFEEPVSGGGGGEITLIGNDATPGTKVTCKTGQITFASETDSRVIVTPSADSKSNATLTLAVYYV